MGIKIPNIQNSTCALLSQKISVFNFDISAFLSHLTFVSYNNIKHNETKISTIEKKKKMCFFKSFFIIARTCDKYISESKKKFNFY